MSLILDALNKADNERSKNNTPSLSSNHDATINDASAKHSSKIIIILSSITVLLLVALVVLYIKDQRSIETNTRSPSPVLSKNASNKQGASPKKSTEEKQPLSFAPQNVTKQETAPAKKDEKYTKIKKKLIEAQYEKATQEPVKQAPKKAVEEETKITSIYEKRQTEQETIQTSSEQSKSSPASLKQHTTIGNIRDLPTAIQQSIPTIMYSAHNYETSNASVTLNNKKRRKGQQVSDQIYIDEILKDGIILRFKGHKFKMAALSSWVNL